MYYYLFPFPKQALVFTFLLYKTLENTVGKGEIACKEQYLLFPQCFLSFRRTFCNFIKLEIVVCNLFWFGGVKNLPFGKRIYYLSESLAYARLTLAQLLATILSWQIVPFCLLCCSGMSPGWRSLEWPAVSRKPCIYARTDASATIAQ